MSEGLLFRQDGHLLDLALEAYVADELDPTAKKRAAQHLAGCELCSNRLAEVASATGAFAIEPADRVRQAAVTVSPLRRRRRWAAVGGGVFATAATIAVLVVASTDAPTSVGPTAPVTRDGAHGVRTKGGRLGLSVLIHDGRDIHVATSRGLFSAGDRLRFRVHPREPGHLMVVGIDAQGTLYPCHPQPGDLAMPVTASSTEMLLDSAVVLDGVAERENILALLCPDPFTYRDVATRFAEHGTARVPASPLWDHCAQTEVVLERETVP
ncbi:MAG: DUF4384 domain-containing protein [Myxococcales bacterium FL481]|nr:MAG: DUF4384 domain-containing protein [Myxococcales bacterium FL481]